MISLRPCAVSKLYTLLVCVVLEVQKRWMEVAIFICVRCLGTEVVVRFTYADHRRLQTCHARKVSNPILDDRATSSSPSSLSHFLGAMRCGKSGRAVYQLHCLLHRVPHSHAQAQEDALKNEGRRQVRYLESSFFTLRCELNRG